MLQVSDRHHNASARIERSHHRADVIARISPGTDTTSRLRDLRSLARRYNDMLSDRTTMLRIAR